MDTFINSASGLFGVILGAALSILFTKSKEKKDKTDDILFRVYMNLLDLNGYYFWFTTPSTSEEDFKDTKIKCSNLSWMIADDIRKIDHTPFLEDILNILMCNDFERFPTPIERHNELDLLIGRIGNHLNPRYQKVIKAISDKNLMSQYGGMKDGSHIFVKRDFNAPGTFSRI